MSQLHSNANSEEVSANSSKIVSSTENNGITVSTENNGITISTENNGITVSTENNGIAVSTENNGITVSTENNGITANKIIKSNRCAFDNCNKKLGLISLSIKCKCGRSFCTKHRHFTDHKCDYNFRKDRHKLKTMNPKIVADKLTNRI